MRKTICFARFTNGKFIGWYSDTFGSITPNSPKLYGYTESQVKTITSNFNYMLNKFPTTEEEELRIVECPEYDGENPEFDEAAHEALAAAYKQKMTDAGIFDIPAPSVARIEAIKAFEGRNPRPVANNWIYADYSKVKEWAKNEPIEFLETIKFDPIANEKN